jgi:hypothetical protein
MSTAAAIDWQKANQRYLSAALAEIKALLVGYVEKRHDQAMPELASLDQNPQETLHALAASMEAPPTLEVLCSTFGLSPFERGVLLLCAGVELDATFALLCAAAHGDTQRPYPTFGLALAVLSGAHWSALAPPHPLRRWRLVELGQAHALTLSSLRIDERILHYLVGLSYIDRELSAFVETMGPADDLMPSQQSSADHVAGIWEQSRDTGSLPIVQLCGGDSAGKEDIAAAASRLYGINLLAVRAHAIPSGHADLGALIQQCEREAVLSNSALFVDCDGLDGADPVREGLVARLLDTFGSFVIVGGRERYSTRRRPTVVLEVGHPTADEQRMIWQFFLAEHGPSGQRQAAQLAAHFNLSTRAIRMGYEEALTQLGADSGGQAPDPDELGAHLWDDCRARTRPHLDALTQRIEPRAAWDDLILPEQQCQLLRTIAIHVRQRARVYDSWGFAARSARGLGISALFAGSSGTGKTMAAEVLANELRLDLYRVDLSATVSKYIGETEKNLRRIFDAAEEGGAMLLFDEADALFGKRSEVKDSHDRYANIEVSYLLQRVEAYRGLAILTTNMKSALDKAFLRRIRFVVEFPFPNATDRARIWQRTFPDATPTEGLDIARLARLNLSGGEIRNIAMNAAFLAAEAGEPVRMRHLLGAVRMEYLKLEKPLTDAEVADWI